MQYHWKGGHGAASQDFLCHASAILEHLGLLPLSSYVWTELVWKLSEHLDSWNWWPVLNVNQQTLDILVLGLRLFELIIVSLISCNDAFRWCLYVIWWFLCRIFLKFAGWTFCLKTIAALLGTNTLRWDVSYILMHSWWISLITPNEVFGENNRYRGSKQSIHLIHKSTMLLSCSILQP
jgi:hypothetical protein